MFESYIYYFKHWLFRKGKITHQDAALGIFLTVVILACGFFAINHQPQRLASETTLTVSPTPVSQPEVLPEAKPLKPAMPTPDQETLNPDSTAAFKPVVTAAIKPTIKNTPKRVLKAKPRKLSDKAMVTKMLLEGKSVRQIARQTGLKRKYIREIKKSKTCNCKAS